jgi:phosphoserine phosphatase RsbU/P
MLVEREFPMDHRLNLLPCGYLSLTDDMIIECVNDTLLGLLGFDREFLIGKHMNMILNQPARIFIQTHLLPMVSMSGKLDEVYLSLQSMSGTDVPFLLNALRIETEGVFITHCSLMCIRRRDEYENEILLAKKTSEEALRAKNEALALKERAERTLLQELQLARLVQESLMPSSAVYPSIEFDAYYKPSAHLSGDLFYWQPVGEDRYLLMIADVMGHGVPSALITMSLYACLRRITESHQDPEVVIQGLNDYLLTELHGRFNGSRFYTSIIYMTIDVRHREIHYVNAGHPTAVYITDKGETKFLPSTIPPLGIMPLSTVSKSTIALETTGQLFLYTDGLLDNTGLHTDAWFQFLLEHAQVPWTNLSAKLQDMQQNPETILDEPDDSCLILVKFS